MLPCIVKSLQFIWSLSTCRFHLRVLKLQINYRDLIWRLGTAIVVPVMATRMTCLIWHEENSTYCMDNYLSWCSSLTHWGRVTHICVSRIIIIGSDNGLSPGRRQAIIWTSAWIFWIEPLGTNFSEISIEILQFSFKKMHLKMASGKWRPFCLGLNVLTVRALDRI